jgi:uncharacterized protein YkwD
MNVRAFRLPLFLSLIAALAAGTMLLNPGSSTPAAALTNCSVSDLSINSEEQAFLTLINQYRAQNGKGALQMDAKLNRMATWHATDMANKNYFSHTDSLKRSFSKRLQQCDASGGWAAENIAAGYQTAQSVFNGWKASSGHNTNMLGSNYKYIGIARVTGPGQYGVYWVTDFSSIGTPMSGGSQPAPTATPTRTSTPGGGGAVATPTRTPTPSSSTKAVMVSPTPGSRFTSTTVTFNWAAASGASEYFLYVGRSRGSNNIYGQSQGLNLSRLVSGLPSNGSTVYVRLWTRVGSTWSYNDYTYTSR